MIAACATNLLSRRRRLASQSPATSAEATAGRMNAPPARRLTRMASIALTFVAAVTHTATCHEHKQEAQQQQYQQYLYQANQQQPEASSPISQPEGTMTALSLTAATYAEDSMKFPLYMRIIATVACLLIFTVGVSGNLLVPLVVIKTKYLRNSTNLFLINLSVADLLVLIVCMPLVLIELHSRPETWLLGEAMCKLSNYVEMLAFNGSIFTILAISFERYYAICKPLRAGYKCTRLRATIIICLVWLLASILTSPILIMAKSIETIYIDGSLVNNCILETNTYWTKMYVFVSMIAFFCLPLLVLMFVYWLIGRRLTRESIAVSATASLSASEIGDPLASVQTSAGLASLRQRITLRKALSLKTLSTFFTSLPHLHKNHQSSNNNSPGLDLETANASPLNPNGVSRGPKKLSNNHSFNLDQRLLNCNSIKEALTTQEARSESENDFQLTKEAKLIHAHSHQLEPHRKRKSLASQFVHQMFHLKSQQTNKSCNSAKITIDCSRAAKTTTVKLTNGMKMNSKRELDHRHSCYVSTGNRRNHTDITIKSPFFPRKKESNSNNNNVNNRAADDLYSDKKLVVVRENVGRGEFKLASLGWLKGMRPLFASPPPNTDSTNLPSESSLALSMSHNNNEVTNPNSTKSILHSERSLSPTYESTKKFAHFNVGSRSNPPTVSSTSSSSTEGRSSVSSESLNSKSATPKHPPPGPQNDEQPFADKPSSYSHNNSQSATNSPISRPPRLARAHTENSPLVGDSLIDSDVDYRTSRGTVETCGEKECDEAGPNQVGVSTPLTPAGGSDAFEFPKNMSEKNHNHRTSDNNQSRSNARNHSVHYKGKSQLSELLVVQDLSKKQQMDSRRQVVIMLAFVVTCFFVLFFPYRLFTIWLILSTDDQVQSLGMETYYNLTYFCRILIYLHSAINPIAYNLISTKFRKAFMSILLCRGSSSRRHYITEHRVIHTSRSRTDVQRRQSTKHTAYNHEQAKQTVDLKSKRLLSES